MGINRNNINSKIKVKIINNMKVLNFHIITNTNLI